MDDKRIIIKTKKYEHDVWEHVGMDALRRTECLCVLCSKLAYNRDDNCKIAQSVFDICVEHGNALAMTRCPYFKRR